MRDNSSAEAFVFAAPSVVLRAAWATPMTFWAISRLPRAASLDVAGDLGGRGRLLLDGAGDRALDVVDLADDRADLGDRVHRALGVGLDRLDLAADVLGGLGGLLGQFLHLVGDDGEALARLAGPGRLDRGVEGQQVRLLGDRGDHLDHLADLGAALAQLGNGGVGLLGHFDGGGGDAGRLVGVLGDLLDARPHLFGGAGDGPDVPADLLGRGRDDAGLRRRLLRVRRHLLADRRQLLSRAGQRLHGVFQRRFDLLQLRDVRWRT